MENIKTFHTNVVGVTFFNQNNSRQDILKKFKSGQKVILKEGLYNNESTVNVLTKNNELIGYIDKEFKDDILFLLKEKRIKKIDTLKVGQNKDILGLKLTIYYK